MHWLKRLGVRIAGSRFGAWLYLHVFPPIDRVLLSVSRGRLSVSIGQPILLLTTSGARTGRRRTTPLMYVTEGEQLVVIGSNGGRRHHPAWYHNLRARPEATVLAPGTHGRYFARKAGGEERARLWQKALAVNPGYAAYQERAGDRRIPIMVLMPLDDEP